MRLNKNRWIALCLIVLIIGFGVGFAFGLEMGLRECISYGVSIAKNFINITFDENKLTNILIKYQTKIQYAGGLV